MRTRLFVLILLLSVAPHLCAQTDFRKSIADNPSLSGGIFTSYSYDSSADAPAPDGYKPFYISHYGRHGSRWHTSFDVYGRVLGWFSEADERRALTDLGRDVYERVKILADDAEGRAGQLTPKGRDEHRGIAERMYRNYTEVFTAADGRRCRIETRSTLVPRCIMSMHSFCERLKELDPSLEIVPDLGERYLTYLFSMKNINAAREKSRCCIDAYFAEHIDPARLVSALFDGEYAAEHLDGRDVMWLLFRLASITQDVDYLGISLYDIFTDDELFELWSCDNVERYLQFGPSADYGEAASTDAHPLLRQIITEADEAMVSGDHAAFLRFGHDVNVVPLVSLLDVEGMNAHVPCTELDTLHEYWRTSEVTPMATNVQFIFFRSDDSDEVLVKVLHNESPCRLPLPRDMFPYYRWTDFRNYYLPLTEQ